MTKQKIVNKISIIEFQVEQILKTLETETQILKWMLDTLKEENKSGRT